MVLFSTMKITSVDVQAAPSKSKIFTSFCLSKMLAASEYKNLEKGTAPSAELAYQYLINSGLLDSYKDANYNVTMSFASYMKIVKSAFATPPKEGVMKEYLKDIGEYSSKTGNVKMNVFFAGGDSVYPVYYKYKTSSGNTILYGYWVDGSKENKSGVKNLDYYSFTYDGQEIVARIKQHVKITLNSSGKIVSYILINKSEAEKNITYTITYNANGGSGAPSSQTKQHNVKLTLSTKKPTRSGYKFLGWSTNKNASSATYSSGGKTSLNKSMTLYAVWSPYKYTIKYDKNYGTGTMKTTTGYYAKSVTLRANAFTRTNYVFAGWNTKKDGSGTSYADKASIIRRPSVNNATVTLYAQWKPKVTVTLDANGGYIGTKTVTQKTKTTGYGLTYGTLTTPKREGYTFVGWFKGSSKVTSSTKVSTKKNHTLTAKWVGQPTITKTQNADFVRIKCSNLGNAQGVYLYINGTKYDSEDSTSSSGWKIKKSDGNYIFSTNMKENVSYSVYAVSYYIYNGKKTVSAKSKTVSFSNLSTKYVSFSELVSNNEDLAIPMSNFYSAGIKGLDTQVIADLTPQGICSTEDYILITGYGAREAKIAVLDKETRKGLAVLNLDEDVLELELDATDLLSHVGGIAYDEEKGDVWVSGAGENTIVKIEIETIDKMVSAATRTGNVFDLHSGKEFEIYSTKYMIDNNQSEPKYANPSFLEYEDGYLYIGTFAENNIGYLRKFKVNSKEKLEFVEELKIPNKIQGAVFTDNGELILSQSYGRKNNSKLYVYTGSGKNLSTYTLKHIIKNVPPMTEELMILDDYLYILYESSAAKYITGCTNVQDTVWAVKVEDIIN